MATLFNTKIKDTYQSLLKLEDNTILTTTSKNITDGLGNASPLYLSTTQVRIGSNSGSAMYWDNTNNRLGIGTNAPSAPLEIRGITNSSIVLRVGGLTPGRDFIFNPYYATSTYGGFFSNESGNITLGASLGTDNGSGIGIILGAPAGTRTALLHLKGTGSTSATTSLLVQNSAGAERLRVYDDGTIFMGNTNPGIYTTFGYSGRIGNDAFESPSAIVRYTSGQLTFYGRNNNANAFSFEHNNQQASLSTGISMINLGGTYQNQQSFEFANLRIAPTYDFNANTTTNAIARGIYYNPTITNLRVAQHRAIETVTGDVIFNGGNVGIGTSSPTYPLHVIGASRFQGQASFGSAIEFGNSGIFYQLLTTANNNYYFGNGSGVTSGGNVFARSINTDNITSGTTGVAYAPLTITGGSYDTVATPSISFKTWDAGNQTTRFYINSRTVGGVGGNIVANPNNGNFLIGTTTDNGYKLNVNGSINIAGGNKLNFSNGSAQCWITNEGGTGLGSRSILIPGTGGGGGFIFYSDGGGPITSFDASGDSIQIRAGSSAITGIMSINKSAASGYGGGTFIYYQTTYGNRMYTFGNPNNERGDESGTHTKIAAGAAGFLGNGGHVYLEAGAKGTQVGSVDGNIIIAATRGNVAIGLTTPTARLQVQGSGSTSATTALLVQNSGGTNTLQVTDDGSLYIGTTVSDLGVIYVPHSPTFGERTFLRMQSGGRQIFATSSNDGLVVKTLGTTFESGITINDGTIVGKSTAVAASVSAYNLPTRIDCFSTANSCLINLSGGGRLQGSSDAQYIRIEGTIQIDGASNELKGFYFNPTLTGAFSPQNVLAIHSTYGGAYLNTATPQASAILQADSTTQGFLPPRVTTAQKNAIATPAEGLMVYDTDLKRPCFFDGTSWITL